MRNFLFSREKAYQMIINLSLTFCVFGLVIPLVLGFVADKLQIFSLAVIAGVLLLMLESAAFLLFVWHDFIIDYLEMKVDEYRLEVKHNESDSD